MSTHVEQYYQVRNKVVTRLDSRVVLFGVDQHVPPLSSSKAPHSGRNILKNPKEARQVLTVTDEIQGTELTVRDVQFGGFPHTPRLAHLQQAEDYQRLFRSALPVL